MVEPMSANRCLYIAHGGGPLPLLGDAGHREMIEQLRAIAATISKPSAIVVVSAHWEESLPTITAAAAPSLIYDYSGFPAEAYTIEYPAAGDPELAQSVADALADAGIEVRLDGTRGFDHGLFVPLKIMYPEADIPCIELSLLNSLDPEAHLRLGEALQSLPAQNLLLLGSGFSFHNMQAFYRDSEEAQQENAAFEAWLRETSSSPDLCESERRTRLINWAEAPGARFCHPREEHLLPLHLCYGMAGCCCEHVYELTILNRQTSIHLW